METFIQLVYFVTAFLFILGLKQMSHPATAKRGIVWAGYAMLAATIVTFAWPGLGNFFLIILGILVGGGAAWVIAKKVAMTDMPQMVAVYNGMGGGAAGAIAAVELLRHSAGQGEMTTGLLVLALLGGLIGAVSFSGSMVAFAKLQGLVNSRAVTFPFQQPINMTVLGLSVLLAIAYLFGAQGTGVVLWFFVLALLFGVLMTIPIGGGDMPVVISLYNAFTGLAVGFEGFAIGNPAMIIAGTVVGAAGTLLTILMAKAMNRSLYSVLFGAFGAVEQEGGEIKGSLKPMEPEDAASLMAFANKVIIVPGYGMAVAQAQQKVKELMEELEKRGVEVKFAIHPVAGRMPGHMNVLLAEVGIPYEKLYDLEEINPEFETADVALVIGANDVVNPAARREGSPLYGMPILDVDKAKQVFVLKRGRGKGFAGIENELFYADNTNMVYGDASETLSKMVQALKNL
ncbi:MAG TPA: NAD(P)(+) transhydrogenase (Re/Si-specific) subunit beta [Oceanithermus profundus]|uniref:NAD(P) transhydrogenase subunit beta n=1 Tax=Oceanithermus profundus TaxID=187137 RepID=A0A7C4ZCN9_9DEIN|nr:NAD(P)(+) transhydrogenase (Re/Si-specific) subunit beta [Oceanithermus profundus]